MTRDLPRLIFAVFKLLADVVFYTIVGALLYFMLSFIATVLLSMFGGSLSMLLVLLVIVLWGQAVMRTRRVSQLVALGHIELAMRHNLPLEPMLDRLAREHWGLYKPFQKLSDALRAGEPLDRAALKLEPMPTWVRQSLVAGARLGRPGPMLSRCVERLRRSFDRSQGEVGMSVAYGVVVVVAMLVILSVITVYIMPKFERIFEDFDVVMPWVTQWTFTMTRQLRSSMWFVSAAALLALISWSAWAILRGRVSDDLVLLRLIDPVAWWTPVWGGVTRRRSYAEACALIGDGLALRLPLPTVARMAASGGINRVLKHRLMQWARCMNAGDAPRDAARRSKLPPAMVQMLVSATDGRQPERGMMYLSRLYLIRSEGQGALLRASLLPLSIVGLALLTGWICLALFLPLVNLISATNEMAML